MINYQILIETISEMVNNDLIYKDGLTLVYTLDTKAHDALDEHFYYKTKPEGVDEKEFALAFESSKEFEVNLGGIKVKFVEDEEL